MVKFQKRISLGRIRVRSECQLHVSPASLASPFGDSQAVSSSRLQTELATLSIPNPLQVPCLRARHFCAFREEVLALPSSSVINIVSPGHWFNVFITVPLHYPRSFQTIVISWRGCPPGLLAGLPAPPLDPVQSTSTLEWALRTQTIADPLRWLLIALRIMYTGLALRVGLTPANLAKLISHHSIPYWPFLAARMHSCDLPCSITFAHAACQYLHGMPAPTQLHSADFPSPLRSQLKWHLLAEAFLALCNEFSQRPAFFHSIYDKGY